jgi:hypothetical protein
MKETPRRRITVTSSLKEISPEQLVNREVVKRVCATLSYSRLLNRYLKKT